jgi:hypothetical protein
MVMNEAEQKMMELFSAEKTTGFENLNSQDYQPPFLIIIQKMSPQVDPSQELYDPAAKIGMIHNTQSLKYYEKVHGIMARYEFRNVEWKPRTSGGGFVGSHDRTQNLGEVETNPLDGRSYSKESGNVIMPTAYYLFMLEEEEWAKVILPMASTQLKKARQFNSKASAIKLGDVSVPLYGRKYTLSTQVETNPKGSWYGWKFDAGENLTDPVLFAKATEASKVQAFLPEKLVQSLPPPDNSVI